jgi:hypothetical protein
MIVHRVSPQQARYTPAGGREKCAFCRFYIAPKWCGHVTGPVSPMGWCKYFSQEMRQQFGGSTVAGGGPSLALDFMNPGTMPPGLTFTRASTATYTDNTATVRTAAVNEPRWNYAAGVSQGLLIEEARTNVDFPSANWLANATVSTSVDGVVQNAGSAPDASGAAMKLIPSGTSGFHQWFNGFSASVNTTYTASMHVKPAGYGYVLFQLTNTGFTQHSVYFDLTNGTIAQQDAGANGMIRPFGDGWYRISVTATTVASAGTYIVSIWAFDTLANLLTFTPFAGDMTKGILVWGSQVEAAASASSLIPTTSGAVTRAADLASMSFTPAASGTWQAEFIPNGVAATLPTIISGNAGSPVMAIGADSRLIASIRSGAAVFSGITPVMAFNAVNKTVFGWLTGGSKAAVNGTSLGANAVALTVTGTSVQLGSDGVTPGNNALNGGLRRVQYWPRQLSDTEMQQVTT